MQTDDTWAFTAVQALIEGCLRVLALQAEEQAAQLRMELARRVRP